MRMWNNKFFSAEQISSICWSVFQQFKNEMSFFVATYAIWKKELKRKEKTAGKRTNGRTVEKKSKQVLFVHIQQRLIKYDWFFSLWIESFLRVSLLSQRHHSTTLVLFFFEAGRSLITFPSFFLVAKQLFQFHPCIFMVTATRSPKPFTPTRLLVKWEIEKSKLLIGNGRKIQTMPLK